jgi:hypothetical protein
MAVRGEGGADRAVPRCNEGESGCAAKQFIVLTGRAREAKTERGCVSEQATGTDNLAPLGRGRGRWKESVRGKETAADMWSPLVRRQARTLKVA